MSKSTKVPKEITVSNLKTLIRTSDTGFRTATDMIKPFHEKFKYKLDRTTISKHLKENNIVKKGGYYVVDNSDLSKKETFTQDLFEQASLKLVSDYDIIFLTVDPKYSQFICQHLQEDETLKHYLLGIIPSYSSIMIFCQKDSKDKVESTIKAYLPKNSL